MNQNLPMVSNIDMKSIYKDILSTCGDEIPAFLIFENQPFDSMHFIMENGNSIIYINNYHNVKKKIISEIKYPKFEIAEAPDFMCHCLEDYEVALLYNIAILFSEELNVKCPQLEFRDNIANYGASTEEDNRILLNTFDGDILMIIRFMAHEFRHKWQFKYHPEYHDSYVKSDEDLDAYFNSISELDAEAFATKLFFEITEFDELTENPTYANGNESVKQKISNLRDEIFIGEEFITKLQDLLFDYLY